MWLVDAVKNLFAKPKTRPVPTSKPKPAPKYKPIPHLKAYKPYIAKWGDSHTTIQRGMAYNRGHYASVSASSRAVVSALDRDRVRLAQIKREMAVRSARMAKIRAQKQAALNALRKKIYGTIKQKTLRYEQGKGALSPAILRARQAVDDKISSIRRRKSGGFWSDALDTITFGQDRRDAKARSWAEREGSTWLSSQVSDYAREQKSFLSEQAIRRGAIEKAKFGSKAEYDRAVNRYREWESRRIRALEDTRMFVTEAGGRFKKVASAKSYTPAANFGRWFGQVTKPFQQAAGNLWKYTLGSGDKNAPSLVTAPSRAVNALGNWLDPKRKIYRSDGTEGRMQKGESPWQASFNQRNFNIEPFKDKGYDAWLKSRRVAHNGKQISLESWLKTLPHSQRLKWQKLYKGTYKSELKNNQAANTALEFLADPLSAVGWAGKAASKAGVFSKSLGFLSKTKAGRGFTAALSRTKESRPVKWLGAEAKTPQQKLTEAIQAAVSAQGQAQKKILPRVKQLHKQLAGERANGLDYSVFDDLAKLSDDEARMLQKMVGGRLPRAKWFVRGKVRNTQLRDKLEGIAGRYKKFTDQMAQADEVTGSRFLANPQGRQYFANTSWLPQKSRNLDEYDFTKAKTKGYLQNSKQLSQSQVDRLFKSDVDNWASGLASKSEKQSRDELDSLLKKYNDSVGVSRQAVEDAFKKTQTFSAKAGDKWRRYNPMAIWKKAVLKYNPAWYANNFLYNTQAAGLAGGGNAVLEQMRLLRPRNFKNAMAEVPDTVRSNLTSEIGRGKLSRFANRVENLSRVAAFRALKQKGVSDSEALKRVNRYLFDYSTKNYERPIKAVVPFYSWQKGLAKAAVVMSFDNPLAAKAYNELDQYQQQQFAQDFKKVIPRLKELGYTDQEIAQIQKAQEKYFQGRLKVGDKYFTTPSNAFREQGLSNLGLNPYLSALSESADAVDAFGRPVAGDEASFISRVGSKFPQANLAKKGWQAYLQKTRKSKPTQKWIGKPGSEGYGMTKEAQGYDSSKSNYQQSLDKARHLDQDIAAFLGVPRSMKFDSAKFLERKTMQKVKDAYFSVNWKDMKFAEAEKKRVALFKKYGITADQFFKGELSKYDSETTKQIKKLKEIAREKTRKLYKEYFAQPKGIRNVWATRKLKKLVDSGYFSENPFLKSFDWTNPDTIMKAYKKIDYDHAKSTGDWSKFNTKYGDRRKLSAKMASYRQAKATGNWTEYNRVYGMSAKAKRAKFWASYYTLSDKEKRRELLRANPQYAKSRPKSAVQVAEAKFWAKYIEADKAGRRELLAKNPKYNRRKNWSDKMWDDWKIKSKSKTKQKLATVDGFTARYLKNIKANQTKAAPILSKKSKPKNKKLVFVS